MALANTLYIPAQKIITAITTANPAQVTTSVAHNYVDGGIVRINIPQKTPLEDFGMPEIDQLYASITIIDATHFNIAIDTTYFTPFAVPAGNTQYAQSTAIGEINASLNSAVSNSLNPQDVAQGI